MTAAAVGVDVCGCTSGEAGFARGSTGSEERESGERRPTALGAAIAIGAAAGARTAVAAKSDSRESGALASALGPAAGDALVAADMGLTGDRSA